MEGELRQRDPLSSFVFLVSGSLAEGLNVMMFKIVQLKLFDGYRFGKDELNVTYIQYTYDNIIARDGKQTQTRRVHPHSNLT